MFDTLEYSLKVMPKGFNKRIWLVLYRDAELNKQWALKTIKTNTKYAKTASDSSIKYLGECLYKSAAELAKDSYLYLEMRSHGITFIGALDPSAKKEWEFISGKEIKAIDKWKYDHTIDITHAKKVNKKWIDYNNKPIKTS